MKISHSNEVHTSRLRKAWDGNCLHGLAGNHRFEEEPTCPYLVKDTNSSRTAILHRCVRERLAWLV